MKVHHRSCVPLMKQSDTRHGWSNVDFEDEQVCCEAMQRSRSLVLRTPGARPISRNTSSMNTPYQVRGQIRQTAISSKPSARGGCTGAHLLLKILVRQLHNIGLVEFVGLHCCGCKQRCEQDGKHAREHGVSYVEVVEQDVKRQRAD